MQDLAQHYITQLEQVKFAVPEGYTHISATPRWDVGGVYVFLPHDKVDEFRTELEGILGETRTIGLDDAICCMLYAIEATIPDDASKQIANQLTEGYVPVAVFFRGATNPFLAHIAKKAGDRLLLETLQKMEEKYKLNWSYQLASDFLSTVDLLVNLDERLATMEYQ